MSQIELIRREVERLIEESDFDESANLYSLLSFLSTLEEQPKEVRNPIFDECVANVDPKVMEEVSRNIDIEDELVRYFGRMPEDDEDKIELARHFAQWGSEHTPLPEDTVLFNKGVEEGKRLMMEETVEGEYDQYPAAIYLPAPIPRMNKGDKVKIIIVKEDEK